MSGRSASNAASVAGFGDLPLSRAPFSATVITQSQLQDAGIAGIGDLTRLDAGITDAYNAPGYWGQLAVRGFTLDNRFNVRRDGLPINAETVIAQGNKQALEVLKGTSGVQAGTSAPGGLVNLVVKRPAGRMRSASLSWEQPGSVGLAADLGDRTGADGALGWRINAAGERLDPSSRDSRGQRSLLAGAFEAQLSRNTLLEAEWERSRQSQPSTPGFSLLGNTLPAARSVDPRLNLNNQPWSLPVVMDGDTGSLRLTHTMPGGTEVIAHAMRQHLRTDDRIAFPFGCFDANTSVYYGDRYCPDGQFDLYDYRSENEQRRTDALDLSMRGRLAIGKLSHRFTLGVLRTRLAARFNGLAYNPVGTARVDGSSVLGADPTLAFPNTNRNESSTEWRAQDAIELAGPWTLWAGLRHSRIARDSVGTDGSEPTAQRQGLTTPWLALSRSLGDGPAARGVAYASWGEGVELEVAPNRPVYANAGQPLPALKSRQFEAGLKGRLAAVDASLAIFDIRRPVADEAGACDLPGSCLRLIDGSQRHLGVEAEAEWRSGPWSLRGSATVLRARREGATEPTLNGRRPVNVPAASVKLQAVYNLTRLPGLALLGFAVHEGDRMVLPDNSVATPGWTRLDLGARYTQRVPGHTLVWRLGIDNVADARAWKESPYQFGHAYLYPLAPRTWHASLNLDF